MQCKTPYKTIGLGLMTAIVFGMTACDSGDYASKRPSDSTAAGTVATTTPSDSSTGAIVKSPGDTGTTAATTVRKKRTRASVTMPRPGTDKMVRDGEGVYNYAQQMPEFPGGQDALVSYLNDHIDYNQKAINNSTDGKIYVSFVVDENGRVMRPRLLGNRKVGDGLDEEAIKAFNNMPAWKPGKVNGKNVATRVELPIVFQLEA